MNFLSIIILSLSSFVLLLLISRLTGNRQISQLSMFDYVSSITIGSIAAEMSTKLDGEWWQPLTAMIVYGILTFLLALSCRKSIHLRKLINGKAVIIYQNGQLYKGGLRTARLDIDDLLVEARNQGYFDLQELQAIVQETNGQLSFLPRAEQRPVKVEDMQLAPDKEDLVVNLVLDGRILDQNLLSVHRDIPWLKKQLASKGYADTKDLLLVTYDCNGTLEIYPQGENTVNPELYI